MFNLLIGKPPKWVVYYENYGNTPSIYSYVLSRIVLAPRIPHVGTGQAIFPQEVKDEIVSTSHLFGPTGMEFTLPTRVPEHNRGEGTLIFTDAAARDIESLSSTFIVFGVIGYRDIFNRGVWHRTEFCFYYDPASALDFAGRGATSCGFADSMN